MIDPMTGVSRPPFGAAIIRWRHVRRMSQLDLALGTGVSQRHISFLESGRASPSRPMVVQLARALDVPLRERNVLLNAAGYAPLYAERGLDSDELRQVRHVFEVIIAAHGPIPAFVVDRSWTVVLSNRAARRLTGLFVAPGSALVSGGLNVARLLLHPDGLRPFIVNWDDVAPVLIDRLEREISARPGDEVLRSLAAELRTYPGVDDLPLRPRLPNAGDLLVPIHLRGRGLDVRLFTTIATIGTPQDITLEEMRSETLLPADAESEAVLRQLLNG